MYRHKWQNNICIKCGVERQMTTFKQRMAIIGSKDIYRYWRAYVYTFFDGTQQSKRPECKK